MRLDTTPQAVASRVRLTRSITLWTLRLVGLTLLVRGVYLGINRAVFAISLSDITFAYEIYTGAGEGHILSTAAAASLVGLALILLARPLSRLAIPMPDAGCPACGHTGEVDRQGRCVECGWELCRKG